MNKKKLCRLANKILALEEEIRLGNNVQKNQYEIENIMCHLKFDEMLELDDYIMNKLYNKKD